MTIRQNPKNAPDPVGRTLKRIIVGESSNSSHIRRYAQYRVRIGSDWYEGGFTQRWFGWSFDDFGSSGMQLNLIDEVFEIVWLNKRRFGPRS